MLNKVDAIDPACAEDLSNIYSSDKIATMCAEASAACGVPVNNVFPMKSYSSEYETDYRVRDWRHETLCFLSLGPLALRRTMTHADILASQVDVAALVILRAILSGAKDIFRLWRKQDRATRVLLPSKNEK